MTHLPYIVAAYAATLAVLGGLVTWVVVDIRTQRRRLDALEAEGGRQAHRGGGA